MIKVTALNKAFGGLRAVSNLSFEAAPLRITSIIGPNGAGKSTAFNLIAGAMRPDSGTVELDGRGITGQAPFALTRLGIARSFQITNLFFGLRAFENVRLACQSLERRSHYLVRLDRLLRPQVRAREVHERPVPAGHRHRPELAVGEPAADELAPLPLRVEQATPLELTAQERRVRQPGRVEANVEELAFLEAARAHGRLGEVDIGEPAA